jgi:hypothetical protein
LDASELTRQFQAQVVVVPGGLSRAGGCPFGMLMIKTIFSGSTRYFE